jgi:hypothetical protein
MAVFEVTRGDTFAMTGVRRSGSTTGSPVDISGATIRAQLRFYSETKALTPEITDGPNGTFTLSATPAETATWTPGRWRCDIEMTVNGVVASSDAFSISVNRDVTL